MKKTFLVIAMLVMAKFSMAQGSLPVGQAQLNAGIGLSEWGTPVYVGIDFGASRDITLGGELSFRSYNENYKDYYYRHHITGVSANANYHFNRVLSIPSNFDFYGGINLGFYSWSSPAGYYGDHTSGLGLGGQLGGRYYFTKKFGVNLEFGGGNAFTGGKIGFTFKL